MLKITELNFAAIFNVFVKGASELPLTTDQILSFASLQMGKTGFPYIT